MPAERSINGRPGNREQLGEVADRVVVGIVHATKLLLLPIGQLGLLPTQLPLSAGDRHALAGAELDEVRLELGKGALLQIVGGDKLIIPFC